MKDFRRIFAIEKKWGSPGASHQQKYIMYSIRTISRLFGALCMGIMLVSCTQDNVHMPEDGAGMETWETYTQDFPGRLSTTVPLVQEHLQGPVLKDMTIRLKDFHIGHSAHVIICTEAFDVDDPFVSSLLGKDIRIGAMEIPQVEYAAYPSGGGHLKHEGFDIQAGEYRTRGTLFGEITKDGALTLTLTYRPGTMPFDIVSEFK